MTQRILLLLLFNIYIVFDINNLHSYQPYKENLIWVHDILLGKAGIPAKVKKEITLQAQLDALNKVAKIFIPNNIYQINEVEKKFNSNNVHLFINSIRIHDEFIGKNHYAAKFDIAIKKNNLKAWLVSQDIDYINPKKPKTLLLISTFDDGENIYIKDNNIILELLLATNAQYNLINYKTIPADENINKIIPINSDHPDYEYIKNTYKHDELLFLSTVLVNGTYQFNWSYINFADQKHNFTGNSHESIYKYKLDDYITSLSSIVTKLSNVIKEEIKYFNTEAKSLWQIIVHKKTNNLTSLFLSMHPIFIENLESLSIIDNKVSIIFYSDKKTFKKIQKEIFKNSKDIITTKLENY